MGEEKILELWRKRGLGEPTEVQKKAYPLIREGKNVLLIAPTGSGKTEAALIPVLAEMLTTEVRPVSLLYITPLRALNRDLLDRIRWWGENLGFRVDVRHGDTTRYARSRQAREPPHILITTPESLQAILPAERMGRHLENVRFVIIDEIHELVAEKRGYQLSVALERLRKKTGHEFQRIGLSATVGSPEVVARFLAGEGRDVEVVDVSTRKEYRVKVFYPTADKEIREESKRLGLAPEVYARVKKLKEIVDRHNQVITFVNTRNMAEQLSLYFSALHDRTDVHHSSLSRDVRLSVERTFKEGEVKHLIATSSMELGIDVGEVDAVVQYGSPRQVTRLIQRVGRSGHRWDRPSVGYIIALDPVDFVEAAVIAKLAKKGWLEPVQQEEKPYDVLAHQIAGMLMDWGEVSIREVYETVTRAQPFRTLTVEELVDVIRQLESERFLRVRGDVIAKSRDTWRYYYSNLSMIPDEEKFFVTDTISGKRVAMLDEDFVASYLETGTVFVVKGRPWRVVSIEDREVFVEPSDSLVGAIPAWIGEMIPVDRHVAREVFRERRRIAEKMETIGDVAEVRDVEKVRDVFSDHPGEGVVLIEQSDEYVVIHVPLGSKGNTALSRLIAAEISRRHGIPVRVFSSAYAVVIEFPAPGFSVDEVEKVLRTVDPEILDLVLENHVTKTKLFKWRFVHVARRFGLISKGAKVDRINVRKLIDALTDSPVYRETLKELLTEKLDVSSVKEFLEGIRSGRYRIVKRKGMGKVGKMELSKALQIPELVSPDTPEHTILELFKRRVLEKKVTLVCTSCGAEHVYKVMDVPEHVSCPRCGSPLVAVVHDAGKARELIRKKRLSKKDEKRMLELIRNAELVKEFGKRAVIAMAVTGVGSQTAARILRVPYSDEEFWKALLDAERNYYRTKMFWG